MLYYILLYYLKNIVLLPRSKTFKAMHKAISHLPDEETLDTPILNARLRPGPSQTYNPLAYPPDINKAQLHGKATRVGAKDDRSETYIPCECCGRNVATKKLPLCCRIQDLYHLGHCFPLYYHFKKFCIYLLFFVFLASGLYEMIMNFMSSKEVLDQLPLKFLSRFSTVVAMADDDGHQILIQTALNLFAIIVFLVVFQYFRDNQQTISDECDRNEITPSDYTVEVSGLENINYTEEALQEFFTNNGSNEGPVEVRRVVIAHDIHELTMLHRERAKKIHEKRKLQGKQHSQDQPHHRHKTPEEEMKLAQIEILDNELRVIEQQLQELEQRYVNNNSTFDLSGVAYVTFNTQAQARSVRRKWKLSWVQEFIMRLCSCFSCWKSYEYNGRILRVKRAPEPSDILWENLSFGGFKKMVKIIKTNIVTAFTILVTALILGGISYWKQSLQKDTISSIVSLVASFITIFVNSVLVMVIKKYASEEHHHSYTIYHRSVATKLTIAQFINTAIVPFVVKWLLYSGDDNQDLYCLALIANDMTYVFLSNAILTPLLCYFDVFYLLKIIKRNKIKKDDTSMSLTQAEANALFEGPQMDISSRYASLVKTVWMAGFYAPLLPICIPICAIGVIFGYMIDKYLLLRRYVVPQRMGKQLSTMMIKYLQLFTFWLAVGNFVSAYLLFDETTKDIAYLCYVGMTLSILHLILPMRALHKLIRRKKRRYTIRQETFSMVLWDFDTDYDLANPVTQAIAEEARIAAYLEKEADEDKRALLKNQLQASRQLVPKHGIHALFKYAATRQGLQDQYLAGTYGNHAMPSYLLHSRHGFFHPDHLQPSQPQPNYQPPNLFPHPNYNKVVPINSQSQYVPNNQFVLPQNPMIIGNQPSVHILDLNQPQVFPHHHHHHPHHSQPHHVHHHQHHSQPHHVHGQQNQFDASPHHTQHHQSSNQNPSHGHSHGHGHRHHH